MTNDSRLEASDESHARTHKSYCRICTAYCGLEIDVADEHIVGLRGDPKDPLSGGYTCIKGRQLAHQQAGPNRLRGAQKRCADGSFESCLYRQGQSCAPEKYGCCPLSHEYFLNPARHRDLADTYG